MKTVFLRVLEELHDKEAGLRRAIQAGKIALGKQRFEVDPFSFAGVPGSPFAYWVSDRLRALFQTLPSFEEEGRVARRGVNSNDDQRFLRLGWECDGPAWVPHVKGGVWSPFYADPHMLVKWGDKGKELQAERVTSRVYKYAIVPSSELYFRPGLTWPRRTKSELSLRIMPAGCIFGDKGPAAIVQDDDHNQLLALLAIANSKAFRALVEFQLAAADAKPGGAAHSYEVGVLQRTPLPSVTNASCEILARLARRAWSLRRLLDTRNETSHAFILPALVQMTGAHLSSRTVAWLEHTRALNAEVTIIQTEIDTRCFELYGIDDADRQVIVEGFGALNSSLTTNEEIQCTQDEPDEEGDGNASADDEATLAAELSSWAIGLAFGRFDVRLATRERSIPVEPDPFESLPRGSPGVLTARCTPAEYPLVIANDGILVDDANHPRDVLTAVRAVFDIIFDENADRWWNDVSVVLDRKGHDLRLWLRSSFFEQHLKQYSRSRRKAPIYWQLTTPSASYSAWLYIHAFSEDTLFRVQNDYVAPKLGHEQRKLEGMRAEAGPNSSSSQRKAIAAQETFVEELQAFLDEVKRVAPLWNPDLDDGVIINFAPLWRLVPQYTPWQKELKATWHALCAGTCDWAHLAMHLWPERVVPKCATDRSLAIAHDLEDALWFEDEDGRWKPFETPTCPIDELVRERSSPAVKAALQSLLDAPIAASAGKRGRRGTSAASNGGGR